MDIKNYPEVDRAIFRYAKKWPLILLTSSLKINGLIDKNPTPPFDNFSLEFVEGRVLLYDQSS